MIKDRYCSFEVSKLLREKGFDEPCLCIWLLNANEYLCPTHQMACDWLRDKGYHIEIYANASGYRFIISKTPPYGTDLVSNVQGPNDGSAWNDYGDCVEAAIECCLTKLIID